MTAMISRLVNHLPFALGFVLLLSAATSSAAPPAGPYLATPIPPASDLSAPSKKIPVPGLVPGTRVLKTTNTRRARRQQHAASPSCSPCLRGQFLPNQATSRNSPDSAPGRRRHRRRSRRAGPSLCQYLSLARPLLPQDDLRARPGSGP